MLLHLTNLREMRVTSALSHHLHTRTAACIGIVLVASATLTGCNGDGTPKKASSSPAPSAPTADPDAKARQDILTAYQNFWGEQVKAYAKASPGGTDLKKYATDKALGTAFSELIRLNSKGRAFTGKPTHRPTVTALDLTQEPSKATINDCLDVTHWTLIDKKTNDKIALPKERLTRYVTVASAEKWGKRWMITEISPKDRPC